MVHRAGATPLGRGAESVRCVLGAAAAVMKVEERMRGGRLGGKDSCSSWGISRCCGGRLRRLLCSCAVSTSVPHDSTHPALPSGATCHAGFNAQRAFDGQALWHRCSGDGDDVPLDDRNRGDRAAQNNKYAPERAEGALNAQLRAGRSGRSA